MHLLSVETTSNVCSVALSSDGALVSLSETHMPSLHDVVLVSLVQQVLGNVHRTIHDVDAVAFSCGPGSFTGLRIGASFVKGLCQTGSPRLLPISTMQALASASEEVAIACGKQRILTVIPSHRELCYVQTFSLEHDGNSVCAVLDHEVHLLDSAAAKTRIAPDMLVVGPGAPLIADHSISGLTRLSARFVAKAAHQQVQSGSAHWADPLAFEPSYLQEFQPAMGTRSL